MATLFGKATPTNRKKFHELLTFIVQGTQGPAGAAAVPKALADEMNKAEKGLFVVASDQSQVAPGNISVSATEAAIVAITGKASEAAPQSNTAVAAAAPTGKRTFVLETGFVPPPAKRGGIKETVYPFAQMAVGQSFFIPATEDHPNPAKGMASTVSSVNRRFAATYPLTAKDGAPHPKAGQPTGKDGRQFTVRNRTVADGEKTNGARVYRVA